MHPLSTIYILSAALTMTSLLMIAREDYASRAVRWIWFPLLALGGIGLTLCGRPAFVPLIGDAGINLLRDTAMNLAFLAIQLIGLKTWFYLRYRNSPAQAGLRDKIGAGDICFLAAAACCCSPLNFIFFYVLSLVFAATVYGLRRLFRRPWSGHIPLAGLQASFLVLILSGSLVLHYSLTSDEFLISKIVRL